MRVLTRVGFFPLPTPTPTLPLKEGREQKGRFRKKLPQKGVRVPQAGAALHGPSPLPSPRGRGCGRPCDRRVIPSPGAYARRGGGNTLEPWQQHLYRTVLGLILAAVVTDGVLDAACAWLGQQRRDWPAAAEVWRCR